MKAVFCLFAALGTVAMASPYDDCTQNYTYIKDDKCSQICLGEKVGVCPVKIVVEAGNLTAGTCPGAGYPHDTGTTQKVKAGPCGNITFEVYDKSMTSPYDDCTKNYTYIKDDKCSQICLGEKVGVCPVKIVVEAGNLTAGTCPAAGYPHDTVTTQKVKAGPCGTITFEVYDKSTDDVSCTEYTHIQDGSCGQDCLGDFVGICPVGVVVSAGNLKEGTCPKAGYPVDTGGTQTVKAGPCGNLEFEVYHKSITALDAPSGVYEGGVPLIIDVKVTINSGTSLDLDLNVKIIKDEVKCQGEATVTSATDITFPNSGKTGDCMGDSLRNQHKDPSKVKLTINSDGSLTFHSPWPDLKLKKKSSVVVLK